MLPVKEQCYIKKPVINLPQGVYDRCTGQWLFSTCLLPFHAPVLLSLSINELFSFFSEETVFLTSTSPQVSTVVIFQWYVFCLCYPISILREIQSKRDVMEIPEAQWDAQSQTQHRIRTSGSTPPPDEQGRLSAVARAREYLESCLFLSAHILHRPRSSNSADRHCSTTTTCLAEHWWQTWIPNLQAILPLS